MIGEILRKKREELGLDLKEVAHSLRIQYEYLKALENNTIEKLPPEVYTRGYIREYARFLNVDPEPLVNEYAEGQSRQEKNIEHAHAPVTKKFSLRPAVLFMPLIAGLVLAIIIYFPKAKPAPPAPQSEHATRTSQSVAPPQPLPPATEHLEAPPVQESPQYVLNAHAIENTWLRIEMEDGKSEEVMMRPPDTKEWTSQKGFDIKIGNAGGVRLVLNGKDIGTPGEKGQVKRLRLP